MITRSGNQVRPLALAIVALGSIAAVQATPAAAGPRHNIVVSPSAEAQEVSFTDLDLKRSADKATLKRRINAAAEYVCLFQGYVDIACRDEAAAEGLDQVRRMTSQHPNASIAAAAIIISR
jgi:UrcA family protein